VDDGADLTATIHTSRRDLLAGIAGGTEVTSTGVLRARNMAREGALAYPRPWAVAYTVSAGKRVIVLAEGRLVGQVCAEAHPAEVWT
jgi:S-adenosylhomocysteine hydrolase